MVADQVNYYGIFLRNNAAYVRIDDRVQEMTIIRGYSTVDGEIVLNNEYEYDPLVPLLLYGCSKADRVSELREGRLEMVWAVQPEEADEEPWFGRIADVDTWQDQIYVADTSRNVVLTLDSEGGFIRQIGRRGAGPGEYRSPRRLTISPSGKVFVIRRAIFELAEFSPDGEFIRNYEHNSVISGAGLYIEWPLALDDSTIVWHSGKNPVQFPDYEPDTPQMIGISGGRWELIGVVRISESARSAIRSLYGELNKFGVSFLIATAAIAKELVERFFLFHFFRCVTLSARMHRISYIMVAPTSAVFPEGSNGGDTSTTSPPIRSRPRRPRTNACASIVVIPPTSGVPVPGANAGSRQSISKEMYVGPSPATLLASSVTAFTPSSVNSSMKMTRIPDSSAKVNPSSEFFAPRIPICTVRSGIRSPSSTARRNGVPWVNLEPNSSSSVSVWASTRTMPTGLSAAIARRIGRLIE